MAESSSKDVNPKHEKRVPRWLSIFERAEPYLGFKKYSSARVLVKYFVLARVKKNNDNAHHAKVETLRIFWSMAGQPMLCTSRYCTRYEYCIMRASESAPRPESRCKIPGDKNFDKQKQCAPPSDTMAVQFSTFFFASAYQACHPIFQDRIGPLLKNPYYECKQKQNSYFRFPLPWHQALFPKVERGQ